MPLHNGQVLVSVPEFESQTAVVLTNHQIDHPNESYLHHRSRWRDTHKQQWNTLAERREIRRRRRQAVSKNRALKRRHK